MRLTPNFRTEEFDCKDGTSYPESWIITRLMPLVADLEIIRTKLEQPIIITSGYRTPAYNKHVGGVLFSQHTQGRAVDIKVKNYTSMDLYLQITELIHQKKIKDGGLGLYDGWVHLDHGPRRRWKK